MKILRRLNRSWQPKVIEIYKFKNLATMNEEGLKKSKSLDFDGDMSLMV